MENTKKDGSIFVYTYSAKQQSEIDAIRKNIFLKKRIKWKHLEDLTEVQKKLEG